VESQVQSQVQIRPDIYEKHASLFGDKTVNGRTVNVQDLIARMTRETRDEFRTLLSARHAFQEQVGRRERPQVRRPHRKESRRQAYPPGAPTRMAPCFSGAKPAGQRV